MYDLIYFGQEPESEKEYQAFIDLIKERFPKVKTESEFDHVHGYRVSVEGLDGLEEEGAYFGFLLTHNLAGASLNFGLVIMQGGPKAKVLMKIINEAAKARGLEGKIAEA